MDRATARAYAAGMNRDRDSDDNWDEEADAEGLLCPLPVLRARKRLLAMAPGAVLRLIASDPAAADDLPRFCAQTGHDLISATPEGGRTIYLIRRGK